MNELARSVHTDSYLQIYLIITPLGKDRRHEFPEFVEIRLHVRELHAITTTDESNKTLSGEFEMCRSICSRHQVFAIAALTWSNRKWARCAMSFMMGSRVG
jgi:hypothetical protein